MNLIVAYDISDPRRLVRVAAVVKDYGVRVQKSIFEVSVDKKLFRKMKTRVEREIEVSKDGVKYFPVCEKCAGNLEIIGQGVYVDPDEEFHVL